MMRRLLRRRPADRLATDAALAQRPVSATVAADLAVRDTAIAARALVSDVVSKDEALHRLAEATWAADHTHWPDGRVVTPAQKSAAADVLRAL